MLFKITCKDIGGFEDCAFTAEGASLDEVAEELMEHGMTHHGEVIKALDEAGRGALRKKIEQRVAEQEQQQS